MTSIERTERSRPRARRPRALAAGALGLGLALGAATWIFLVGGARAESARPAPATVPAAPADNADARTLGQSAEDLQRQLRTHPQDWRSWGRLGFVYVEQARVTANPALYPKAEGAFTRSLQLQPKGNFAALAGRAALANGRHDFAGGLRWGAQARRLNPKSPEVEAVVGDSLIELGRYEEAFAAYQKMVDLGPGVASYTRASFALDLQGDVAGARRALELALGEALSPQEMAFPQYSLGELAWNRGDVDEARRRYEEAVRLDPAFVPPQAGLARLHAATGETERAVGEWKAVVARTPLPEYVAELGNLYLVTGREAEAEQQFSLLQAQRKLLEANGVNVDLEIALFTADHSVPGGHPRTPGGVDLGRGLKAAQAEWDRRKSIHVADALAWQLHANGRDAEALPMAEAALRLGTRNALFLFHRGMIHQALGQAAAARGDLEEALAINPHFSLLHQRAAAETLAALSGAR
jgi:tetratricopeptide (TPR) repeat protein